MNPGDLAVYRPGHVRKSRELAGFLYSVLGREPGKGAAGTKLELLLLRDVYHGGTRFAEGSTHEEFETCLHPLEMSEKGLRLLLLLSGSRLRDAPA